MWWIWGSVALADPAVEVEIVKPEEREGTVALSFPGREGEAVKVDGWELGTLPVETKLAQGVHTFSIEGKLPFSVATRITFEGDETLVLDLSAAVPVDVDAPTGIRVISTSSSSLRLDGSVEVDAESPATETPPKPEPSDEASTP